MNEGSTPGWEPSRLEAADLRTPVTLLFTPFGIFDAPWMLAPIAIVFGTLAVFFYGAFGMGIGMSTRLAASDGD